MHKNLGENFINRVVKANRSKILKRAGVRLLRDENHEGGVQLLQERVGSKTFVSNSDHIRVDNMPKVLKEKKEGSH